MRRTLCKQKSLGCVSFHLKETRFFHKNLVSRQVSTHLKHTQIITTGSELLLGELVDTNTAFIARRLRSIGLNLYYKMTVGDNVERMVESLRHALTRSDVIVTTGGLGPTVDDVTRQAVAQAIGRELVFRPDSVDPILGAARAPTPAFLPLPSTQWAAWEPPPLEFWIY